MTVRVSIITESDLADYVDGTLDGATANAVEQAMLDDLEVRNCVLAALSVRCELNLLLYR